MKQNKRFLLRTVAVIGLAISCGVSLSLARMNHQPIEVKAAAPSNYYSSVTDDMMGTTLLSKLKTIINTSSVSVSYDWYRYEAADQDPNNSSNVLTIYARTSLSKSAHVSGNKGWNREHTFPASKLSDAKAEKDNHIIYASDYAINSARSNIKMGVVESGSTLVDSYGNSTTCRKGNSKFDPNNRARGIVARTTMYAAAMYGYDPTDNFESIETMLLWHLTYTVDSFDQKRNDVVYSNQHNRNPFVDHPEYACRIWGDTSDTARSYCAGHYDPVPGGDSSDTSEPGGSGEKEKEYEYVLTPWGLGLIIGGSVLALAIIVTVVVIIVIRKKKKAK